MVSLAPASLNWTTKAVGTMPRAGTPKPTDNPPLWEFLEFRTCRYGSIVMHTSDDATMGPGMCYFNKTAAGGGEESNNANHRQYRFPAGRATIVKGEDVSAHNGNILTSTHNNINIISTGSSTAVRKGQGGSTSINGLNEASAAAKDLVDRPRQFSTGGSMGFDAGLAMGFVAADIGFGASFNFTASASGGASISSRSDCVMGSRGGCLHGFGKGISFGSLGPSTYQAVAGSMNILTDANEININPGGGAALNLWTAGQINAKTPAMVAIDGSSVYINSNRSAIGARIDRNMNVQMTGLPQPQRPYIDPVRRISVPSTTSA